ncbi:MAG TPA: hypothetical protein VJB63_02530 [Patescibacteria group bacterium]|nr:hypothetical protein [Patescibacteria group bacterium]
MVFNQLFDYSYKRNLKQAIAFYLVHMAVLTIVAVLVEFLIGLGERQVYEKWSDDYVGTVVALLFTIAIFFLTLLKKRQWSSVRLLFMGIMSGVLACFGGGILGFIPVAYMSTVVNNNAVKKII